MLLTSQEICQTSIAGLMGPDPSFAGPNGSTLTVYTWRGALTGITLTHINDGLVRAEQDLQLAK